MSATRKVAIKNMATVLRKRRDALRRALAGDLSLLKKLRVESGDAADLACDSAHNELTSQLAEVETQELARVERALEMVRFGTYGECDMCGKNIPMARLNALPYATHCITCQRDAERCETAIS